MKFGYGLISASALVAQEGQVSFELDQPLTVQDFIVSSAIMLTFGVAFAAVRQLQNPLRNRLDEWDFKRLRWRLPLGMLLCGGLLVAGGWLGLSESLIWAVPVFAWSFLNLPALAVAAVLILPWASDGRWILLPGAATVWLQWYGLVRWIEARAYRDRSLLIR